MPSKSFNRRYYNRLGEIFSDAKSIITKRKQIKSLMRDGTISNDFRERIMLTVTEVNGCRYCQYAHARMALKAGLSRDEIDQLAEGAFHDCPPEDVPALLYAQHWAEADGNPDLEARKKVIETYGQPKTEAMELAMHMIRMGNLLGNTFDRLIFKLFPRLYAKNHPASTI